MGLKTQLRRYLSPHAYLRGLANKRSGRQVSSGPFKGMKYVSEAHGSVYIAKLLGTYEREIYPVLQDVIDGDHDLIIDVGAAEGYYAIGMAARCDAPIVAYEMNDRAQRLLTELAAKNGVEKRIQLRGECDAAGLEEAISGAAKPFILMDAEGAESELLDPDNMPSLAKASVLVEIHEFARPGVTAELMRRFSPSHDVQVMFQEERSADEFPYTSAWTRLMPEKYLRRAVEEQRSGPQSWMWLTPLEETASRAAA